jgi:hypothetical protein
MHIATCRSHTQLALKDNLAAIASHTFTGTHSQWLRNPIVCAYIYIYIWQSAFNYGQFHRRGSQESDSRQMLTNTKNTHIMKTKRVIMALKLFFLMICVWFNSTNFR